MGLIDKLKGHKRDESRKSFDEVASEKKSHRRSASLSRKSSTKKGERGVASDAPPLPGTNVAVEPTTATYNNGTTDGVMSEGGRTAAGAAVASNGTHAVERKAVAADVAATSHGHTTTRTADTAVAGAGTSHANPSEVGAVTEQFSKMHIPVSDPNFDRSKLSNTPFDVKAFFGDKTTTTKHSSTQRDPVIQEVIHPTVTEIIHPIFHREHHVTHHQTRIQPVLEAITLPPRHYVIINGEKHEIQADAIVTHVLQKRDYIPVETKPQITVRSYVGTEPVMGPILPSGQPSPINKEVEDEHRRMINASYEPGATSTHAKEIPASVLNRGQGTTTFTGYPPTKLEASQMHTPGFVPTATSPVVAPTHAAGTTLAHK